MSIIDETLKKLARENAPDQVNAFSQMKHAPDTMTDMAFVAEAGRKRSLGFPLLALALFGAGFLVYFLLPELNLQTAKNSPAVAAINSRLVQTVGNAEHAVMMPVAPAVAAINAVQPASGKNERASHDELVVSAAASSVQSIPVAVSPPETAAVDQTVPAWYEAGWRAVKAGKGSDGLAFWEDGVRSLPTDRMVIAGNSYNSAGMLMTALNRHIKLFPTIGVRQHTGGKVLYRVIVFPYGEAARQVLPKVQQLFSHAVLMNASRVQYLLSENPQQVTTQIAGSGASFKEKQIISRALPPAQPSVKLKTHVEKLDTANRIVKDMVAPVIVNADEWESRAATIREQLHAEDYAGVSINAQTLARDFPGRWEPWFWLGTAQLVQGHMDSAESALERAGKLNSTEPEIWVQRSIVAQEHNDNGLAISLLNKARELSPDSPKIYLNLGYSYQALGMTAEANKSYLRFLSMTEGDSNYAMQRKSIMKQMESRQ